MSIKTLAERLRSKSTDCHESEAALYLEAAEAVECWSIVEQLRANEAAIVELFCDNPEPIAGVSSNNVIQVCDDWTGWRRRRFEGDSILDALRGAKAAHDAHVAIQEARKNG